MSRYVETNQILFRLAWIFSFGCLFGYVVETLYCLLLTGTLTQRATLAVGPFSLVWGVGAIYMSMLADGLNILQIRFRKKTDATSITMAFLAGFTIGGVHEYTGSLISELFFGAVNWDYSHLPMHLQGRTCLQYCIYWGLLAIPWCFFFYPALSGFLRRTPWKIMLPLTAVMLIFMILNIYISCSALDRYNKRRHGQTADTSYAQFLDLHFDNEFMARRYPGLIFKD